MLLPFKKSNLATVLKPKNNMDSLIQRFHSWESTVETSDQHTGMFKTALNVVTKHWKHSESPLVRQ